MRHFFDRLSERVGIFRRGPAERGPYEQEAGRIARFGSALAVLLALAFVEPAHWRAYAVLFALLTVLDLFWIDIAPPVPVGLPYVAILFAFIYIVGPAVLVVQVLVWPVSLRLVRLLARRGWVTPPYHVAALVRDGRGAWGEGRDSFHLARFHGMVGVLGRYAGFRAALALDPEIPFVAGVLCGEVVGYLALGVSILVLPFPAREDEPARGAEERELELMRAAALCLEPLIVLIVYGYRIHGLVGAAGSAVACLVFHHVLREMNQRRLRLGVAKRNLERAGEALRERTERLDEANRALVAQARALEQKQEELRAFVYTVTHDLRNPLSAILLNADIIRDREGERLSPQGREDLDSVMQLASRGEELIRDLLNLFRITSREEKPGEVDLQSLVADALETLRPQIAAKGVQVEVGRLPSAWGQVGKLRHAFVNLLSNAVKYVPAGAGEVTVTGELRDGETRLCFRDNGVGIAPEFQQNIFDLFMRVPSALQQGQSVEGTGVGLAIVRRCVEACGGSVRVESAEGQGSRFYVTLRAPGPEPEPAQSSS